MELARELVAHAGWDWDSMTGMAVTEWSTPGMALTDGRPQYVDGGVWVHVGRWLPVLSDPATWGALLVQLPPTLDIAADAVGVSILMFTGAGNVTARGSTWGEAVAKGWLATRGGGT